MSKSPPPITPAFAWALPDTDYAFRKAKESPKPVPNPLLNRTPPKAKDFVKFQSNGQIKKIEGNSDAIGVRSPFSSLLNSTSNLRQRRKNPNQSFPPKLSITDGSFEITNVSNASIDDEKGLVLWEGASNGKKWNDNDCVLVYGFSFPEQVDEVIRRFECFGKVVGIRYNGKNWLAIRYESLLEVEKVLCQQPCLLSDGTLVGVAHMDKVLTQGLHFDAIPDFYRAQEFGICRLEEEKSGLMENDVLISEKMESSRKLSFCEQLLAFIFGWDYSLEASN